MGWFKKYVFDVDKYNELMAGQRARERLRQYRRDSRGVNIFWWLFWLVVFFPALIIVAIVHNGRKNRAALYELGERK